jgi:hypothetical protein
MLQGMEKFITLQQAKRAVEFGDPLVERFGVCFQLGM